MAYEDHCFARPWGAPETVVMVHGNAESSRAWTPWVPHLAGKYRVVRLDMPGFGASSEPPDYGWSADELAADIVRFLDAAPARPRVERRRLIPLTFFRLVFSRRLPPPFPLAWGIVERRALLDRRGPLTVPQIETECDLSATLAPRQRARAQEANVHGHKETARRSSARRRGDRINHCHCVRLCCARATSSEMGFGLQIVRSGGTTKPHSSVTGEPCHEAYCCRKPHRRGPGSGHVHQCRRHFTERTSLGASLCRGASLQLDRLLSRGARRRSAGRRPGNDGWHQLSDLRAA